MIKIRQLARGYMFLIFMSIGTALRMEITGVNPQFRSLSRGFLCWDIQCFVKHRVIARNRDI